MSVYNREDLVERAIESILKQTFTDFEFIIVDDGSTDRTAEILDRFARKDNRVKVITQINSGIAIAVNQGIDMSRGEFIARMDSDDVAHLTRFEKQVAYLDGHPDIALVGTWARRVDDNGELHGELRPETDPDRIYRKMMIKMQFVNPTIMMRRGALIRIGTYQQMMAEDYDLLFRFVHFYRTANIPEILLDYRFAAKNFFHAKQKGQEFDGISIRLSGLLVHRRPFWQGVYLIKPCLSALIPIRIKKMVLKLVGVLK